MWDRGRRFLAVFDSELFDEGDSKLMRFEDGGAGLCETASFG